MNESVQGKESAARKRCRLGFPGTTSHPQQTSSGDQVGASYVAYEMKIQRAGLVTPGIA